MTKQGWRILRDSIHIPTEAPDIDAPMTVNGVTTIRTQKKKASDYFYCICYRESCKHVKPQELDVDGNVVTKKNTSIKE